MVRVDISGKLFGRVIIAKLIVNDCTCSGVIIASADVGTAMRRV